MPKRILSGVVISSNSNKTITVDVTRRIKHKLYKKIIRRTKKYHAHDENNEFNVGDNVSIIESKPISKLKKWNCRLPKPPKYSPQNYAKNILIFLSYSIFELKFHYKKRKKRIITAVSHGARTVFNLFYDEKLHPSLK